MPQLASPEEFIGPSLAQAWADYQVAIHLSDTGLDDNIHRGRPACDAAMAKFQQSLEKALSAVLLRFCPERSEWAFFHKYLSSNVKEVRQKAKRELSKVLEFLHHDYARSLSLRLAALEKHVPDPGRATPDKKSGKLVALPVERRVPIHGGGKNRRPLPNLRQVRRDVHPRREEGSRHTVQGTLEEEGVLGIPQGLRRIVRRFQPRVLERGMPYNK